MALKDSYNDTTKYDGAQSIYLAHYGGQTFTASSGYTIDRVKLYMYRVLNSGTVTASIRAVTAHLPSGPVLATGSITQANIGTSVAWHEIILTVPLLLVSGTEYAIDVRAESGNSTNKLMLGNDQAGATYTGGNFIYNNVGGVGDWNYVTGRDTLFETYAGFEDLSTTINITTNFTSEVLIAGTQLIESIIPINFVQSQDLTVIGEVQLQSSFNITFGQSANLSIFGNIFLDSNIYIRFSIEAEVSNVDTKVEWLINRPQSYNEDDIWGYDHVLKVYRWMNLEQAASILATGGGRYHQQLVIVGHKCVYFTGL